MDPLSFMLITQSGFRGRDSLLSVLTLIHGAGLTSAHKHFDQLVSSGYFRVSISLSTTRVTSNQTVVEKLVEMAAREKSRKHRQKSAHTTFEESSIDSTAVEEKLFGQAVEDEDGDDGPVVFICGKCKLPVGDSLSWDGSEDGQNQIRLKRVTDNVLIGKDNRMYEVAKRSLCLIVDLSCRGCHSVLGMVYASTPKNLDHKRFTFCLNVADIDSYVLGSASQMLAAEGPKEQPVTLEYRGIVEQQLTEVVLTMTSA